MLHLKWSILAFLPKAESSSKGFNIDVRRKSGWSQIFPLFLKVLGHSDFDLFDWVVHKMEEHSKE